MWSWLLTALKNLAPQILPTINFGAVFNSIKVHWRIYLIAVLVGLLAFTSYTGYHERDLLKKEQASHQQDVTNFKNAQAAADAQAKAVRQRIEKESKASADAADAKYRTLIAQYRANLVRYKANQSGTTKSSDSELQATEGGNGSSEGSEFPSIVISEEDAQICAVNTARLQAVHDWALTLPKDAK